MILQTRSRSEQIEQAFQLAAERYAELGIDAAKAVDQALRVPLSFHCWQADDVVGLENRGASGGGILATGSYPGRARNGDEMRQDFEKVLELCPGTHRLNLHACYAEMGGQPVDRDALEPQHFARWMDWAGDKGLALDFNPTFFAHKLAADGTLSAADDTVRAFWVRHGQACRRIATEMARRQGEPCVINHWLPDGEKDLPADRWAPRKRLMQALDAMIADDPAVDRALCLDCVESKLFGIGIESYTVGSAEFYSSYALSRGLIYCLDQGHFHPTESIADKISAYLTFHQKLLVHLSRPVRWDSDHVVLFDDELRSVFYEIARGHAWSRVLLATDFFDASINRIGAYVIGLRAVRKAILSALLAPLDKLAELERSGRRAERLATMEELKTLPFGAVWDHLCEKSGKAPGADWIASVSDYESSVLAGR